jgi:predicted nucleotidyltransferase
VEESDIDLIVVSKDWRKFGYLDRLRILGVAAARILEPIEASAFTPDEIQGGRLSPFWEHILKHEALLVSTGPRAA